VNEVIDLTEEEKQMILLWNWFLTRYPYESINERERERERVGDLDGALITHDRLFVGSVKLQYSSKKWPEVALLFVVLMQPLIRSHDLHHVLYRHLTSLEFAQHLPEHTKLTCMGLAAMPISTEFLQWSSS
jgi:hypothetical protein